MYSLLACGARAVLCAIERYSLPSEAMQVTRRVSRGLQGSVSAAVNTRRLFALMRTVPKMPRHIAWFRVSENNSQSPGLIVVLRDYSYSYHSRPSDRQTALVIGRPAKFNRESHDHVRRELRSPRATSADHRLPLVLTPSSVHCSPECYSPAPSGRPEDGRLFSVRSRSFSLRRHLTR